MTTPCKTCQFWLRKPDQNHGQCHSRPPQMVNLPAQEATKTRTAKPSKFASYWPITYQDDWCGEHQLGGPG